MRRVSKIENLQSQIDGILVRPVHPDDVDELYTIISDPMVSRTMVFTPSMEYTETQEWVEKRDPHEHRLVAEIDGRVVGSGSMTAVTRARTNHSGSLGLMVHPDYWNRRVGTSLVAGLLNLADNWLILKRVELEVFSNNTNAVRLYQKFGFEIECTMREGIFGDGRYLEEYFMARLRGLEGIEASTDPAPGPATDRPKADVSSLKIRAMHPDDAEDLYYLWANPQVGRTTMQLPSQELWLAEKRVENRPPGYHRLVADVDGTVVGTISIGIKQNPRMRHTAHLGMMVSPDYWGVGIGSRLMAAVLDLADNWLNLHRVELEVHTDNPAAVHLYEKFGFEIEGTKRFHTFGDGRWTDTYLMSRLNGVD
jgi:putative acetyltransferase